MTAAPEAPASAGVRAAVCIRLAELGIRDAEQQRHVCRVWTRRPLTSRTELTEGEASTLAKRLRTMTAAELAAVVARPAPEPEPELPPGAIACGPGPLTEHDAATVRAFAAALDEGPAAVRAFALTEPTAEPPAVEPPPVDVEAAAEDAVRRFRERQAAGVLPEPPDPSARPPRVVVPYTAPGRYCLTRCYCGTCPQYAEQREAAERAYRQELTAARNKDLRR